MTEFNTKTRRTIRTKEQRIAELRNKIDFHQDKIVILQNKITSIEADNVTMRDVALKIKNSGLPLERVMQAIDALKI